MASPFLDRVRALADPHTASPAATRPAATNGVHPDGAHAVRPPVADVFDRPLRPLRPLQNGQAGAPDADAPTVITTTAPAADPDGPPIELDVDVVDSEAGGGGVHTITRSINYWFNREIGRIESLARRDAAEWATKGLPRHDVARTEPLEPEQVLGSHAVQLFRDWLDRVRVKMQDAIEDGSQRVGDHVARLRAAVTRLEGVQAEAAATEREMRELHRASAADVAPVRYEKIIPSRAAFWTFAVLLAGVEFFANYPVFRLMLPMDAGLADAARLASEDAEGTGWTAGARLLFTDMAFHIEALFVALVAVIVLVLLGKTLGGSTRPLLALRETEHPLASTTIRAHRRQHGAVAVASGVGVVCALVFLFLARDDIATTAQARVAADSVQVDRLEAQSAVVPAGDFTQANTVRGRIRDAERVLEQHRDDAAYATTVHRNNGPILALNLALVLAAAVLGFAYKAEDLTEKRGEHPGLAPLRAKLDELRRECYDLALEARGAAGQAHAAISRVQHLLRSNPLQEWHGKKERVEGLIPLFRAENARIRGLDPASVLAFQTPYALPLPRVDEQFRFTPPEEFSRLRDEFADLNLKFAVLAPRSVTGSPQLAVVA